jgi:ankyrin repeat protein
MSVEAGGSVNSTDRFGLTALMMASWAGHEDVCLSLLGSKANPDQRDNAGWTAMHHAVLGDYDSIVRLLLRHGADGTIKTNDGTSCVSLASQIQAPYSRKALSGMALEMGISEISPLFNASAYEGNVEVLKSLIEETKFDPNMQDIMGRNAIHLAALGGHLDAFSYLQSQGARLEALDKMGRSVVDYAAMGSNVALVDKVLELVVPDVSQGRDTWSPLHWACRTGGVDIVQKLLDYGFEPSAVQTVEPNHWWYPLDIADYCRNTRLLGYSGFKDVLGPRSPNVPQLSSAQKVASGFSCDACEQVIILIHSTNSANIFIKTILSPRFHLSGQDFDYCFMCNATRHLTHPPECVFEVL